MYVKIIEHLEGNGVFPKYGNGDLVVPTRNHVFETDSVEYKKVRVTSQEEYKERVLVLEEYTTIGCAPILCNCGPGDECSKCQGDESSFEFLVISIYNAGKDTWRNIVAPGCSLYVMNDQGKTIDSVICH